jgi:hypothetical protein
MPRRPTDPLANDTRLAIVEILSDTELRPVEIRRMLPGDPTFEGVAYHLAVLERAGIVQRLGGVCRLTRSGQGNDP